MGVNDVRRYERSDEFEKWRERDSRGSLDFTQNHNFAGLSGSSRVSVSATDQSSVKVYHYTCTDMCVRPNVIHSSLFEDLIHG